MLISSQPCAFLAGDYILLGRLVQHLDAPQYLRPFKPGVVSWSFIGSDSMSKGTSFSYMVQLTCTQSARGGLSISKQIKTAKAGGNIFLAGIALQMASFLVFTALWFMFAFRAYYQDKVLWSRPGWKGLHYALGFTCICFLIRSVFRTVELSQGWVFRIGMIKR
jgi:hypothetical protein